MRTDITVRIILGSAAVLCCAAFAGCGKENEKEEKLTHYQLKSEITVANTAAKALNSDDYGNIHSVADALDYTTKH